MLGLSSVVSIGAVEISTPIHGLPEMSAAEYLQARVDIDFLEACSEENLDKIQNLLSGKVYPIGHMIPMAAMNYPGLYSEKVLSFICNYKYSKEQKQSYKKFLIAATYCLESSPKDHIYCLNILNLLQNFGTSNEEFHELKPRFFINGSNETKSAFEFAQFALYPESRPNDTVIDFCTLYAIENDAHLGQELVTGAFITACNTRKESTDPLIIHILKKVINGDENAPPMELFGAMFDNLITNHANTYKESSLNKLPEYMRRFIISFGGDMDMQNFQDKSQEILNRVSEKDPDTYNQFLIKMQEKGYLKSLHLVNIPNNNAVQNHDNPLENENNPEAVHHGTNAHALEENKEDHGA